MGALAYSKAQYAFLHGQQTEELAPRLGTGARDSPEEIERILNVVRSRQGAVLGKEVSCKGLSAFWLFDSLTRCASGVNILDWSVTERESLSAESLCLLLSALLPFFELFTWRAFFVSRKG